MPLAAAIFLPLHFLPTFVVALLHPLSGLMQMLHFLSGLVHAQGVRPAKQKQS